MTEPNAPAAPQPARPPRPPAARQGAKGANSAKSPNSPKGQNGPNGPKGPKGRTAPRRAPHPLLEQLATLYPKLFGARFLPLKRGVFEDLQARHAEQLPAEALKVALGDHTRSTRYLEAVASGLMRHDLDGQPQEPVAPEHVHHAVMEVWRRRVARGQAEAAQAWRQARLVAAIEASGLSAEDYRLRVPTRDAQAQQALDEALAAVGARAARREALRRAFQASGRTVAEFAEMYGMDLAEVQAALG